MSDLFEEKEFLQNIYFSLPLPMILFDSSGNIIIENKAAENLPSEAVSSSIKDSIEEIINSNLPYRKRIIYKYMDKAREKEMSVLIKGSILEYDGNKYVLMVIQDLAEIMQADGVVKVCSNCKKVKRTEYSWQDIEVYIKGNLANVQFSHCICPDCSEKLYNTK